MGQEELPVRGSTAVLLPGRPRGGAHEAGPERVEPADRGQGPAQDDRVPLLMADRDLFHRPLSYSTSLTFVYSNLPGSGVLDERLFEAEADASLGGDLLPHTKGTLESRIKVGSVPSRATISPGSSRRGPVTGAPATTTGAASSSSWSTVGRSTGGWRRSSTGCDRGLRRRAGDPFGMKITTGYDCEGWSPRSSRSGSSSARPQVRERVTHSVAAGTSGSGAPGGALGPCEDGVCDPLPALGNVPDSPV